MIRERNKERVLKDELVERKLEEITGIPFLMVGPFKYESKGDRWKWDENLFGEDIRKEIGQFTVIKSKTNHIHIRIRK